jgi:hypothetical protein
METENQKDHWPHSKSDDSIDREKRSGMDRRTSQRAVIRYLLLNGRREEVRRSEDQGKMVFFDRYNPKLFAVIMAILWLSVFDAFLTLQLIVSGSAELNPIMALFLDYGSLTFVVAKYFLTSLGVVILLIFKNAFRRKAKLSLHSLYAVALYAFGLVILWELFLLLTTP